MAVYDKLKVFSPVLKELRKDSGLTQQELATRLGISRETVIAIEKENKASVTSLEMGLVYSWWRVCKIKATVETAQKFIQVCKNLLDI